MNYINNNKKKKKRNSLLYILGIVICITISLYLVSKMKIPGISEMSGSIVNGISNVSSSIGGTLKNGESYFGNTKKLNDKINSLEKKVSDLQYELLEKETLETENNDLRKSLNMKEEYSHFNIEYANVIYRNYDNWNQTFVINKGSNNGIKKGFTVITNGGLVGYISTVSKTTSVVTTIIDPSTSVSIEISSVNELALLKGDFSLKNEGKVKLTYIPIDVEVSVNETVYTSGIGENYQKGIPVGKIESIINKKNDMDRYAIVTPFVNFNSIDLVGVIID